MYIYGTASKISEVRQRAKQLEDEGKLKEAAEEYLSLAKLYEVFATESEDYETIKRRKSEAERCKKRAHELVTLRPAKSDSKPQIVQGEDEERDERTKEVYSMLQKTNVSWDSIGGLAHVKDDIKMVYGLVLAQKPENFRFTGWRRILFFGPPGTGKTLLAAAISSKLNAPFFNVKTSSILSKWVGDAPKLISSLFQVARKEADEKGFAVIFFDEFDSIATRRTESVPEYARQMLATLLVELDGLAEKDQSSGVLTVAATNVPQHLDPAILSRFQKRIYIPLPDADARKEIVQIIMKSRGASIDFDLDWFSKETEFFSGRDIERLCQEAANIMILELNKDLIKAVDHGEKKVREYKLNVSSIKKEHIIAALARVVVDKDKMKQFVRDSLNFAEEK